MPLISADTVLAHQIP